MIDEGKEFYNFYVKKLLIKYKVYYFSVYSCMKLSLLECFNCIFKEKIYCYMIVNGICKFIDVVFFLVLGYNNIIYIVIKMCLVEINLFNVLVLVRWFYG